MFTDILPENGNFGKKKGKSDFKQHVIMAVPA